MTLHHKYNLTELENLIPFERDIYVEKVVRYLKELEDRQNQQS